MSVGRICVRSVQVAEPGESVRAIAQRMAEAGTGTVVVLDADRRAVGMLTDRDIALRCVAKGLDPEVTEVASVMSQPITSVRESTPIEDALGRMLGARSRRLVVTDEASRLVGLLALDDVLALLAEEARTIGRLLDAQAPGSD